MVNIFVGVMPKSWFGSFGERIVPPDGHIEAHRDYTGLAPLALLLLGKLDFRHPFGVDLMMIELQQQSREPFNVLESKPICMQCRKSLQDAVPTQVLLVM